MNDKLLILLDKIKLDNSYYHFFEGGVLDKIVGNKETREYKFFITLLYNLPLNIYEEFLSKLKLGFKDYGVSVHVNVINKNYNLVSEYYDYLIKNNAI